MFKIITKEITYYVRLNNISTIDVENKSISFKKDTLHYSIENIENIEELITKLTKTN